MDELISQIRTIAPDEPSTEVRLIAAVSSLVAFVGDIDRRVAALEAMLKPVEVVADDWSIDIGERY